MNNKAARKNAVFDLNIIAKNFPDVAETMLIDTRLTDEVAASSRVFRTYTAVGARYHSTCDEYLLVLSGRAMFFLDNESPFELSAGKLIFFEKGTVHGVTEILEEPLVVFAVDTPRRDPSDVIFVNPSDGTAETYIQTKRLY